MNIYQYNDTIKACRMCLMCRHACTVGNVTQRDTNLPRGKAILMFADQMEMIEWDERAVEIIYQCTNCHLCREWCVNGWDIAPVMLAARADLVEKGLEPSEAKQIKKNFEASGNLYGAASSQLTEWLDKDKFEFKQSAPVLYFAGCTTAFRQPEIAQATIKLMQYMGVDYTVLPQEPCCGETLYVFGYREQAKALAEKTLKQILETGAKTVVSSSPTCIDTFRHGYREWGVELPDNIRFVHISEYLAGELASGRLQMTQSLNSSLTYHDPCSLGRELRVFDEPRQILQAIPGVDFREMKLNRHHSPCCGNGGGVPTTNFDIAFGAGKNAGEVIQETAADILVTACPDCKQSLKNHVRDMEVLDIAEVIVKALDID